MDRGNSLMGWFDALWGGFSSFFSIWQVCILQISPFFLAYIGSLYLISRGQQSQSTSSGREIWKWVAGPYFAYAAGFTIFYSLLVASGLGISRMLTYNISNLRIISGMVILLVSLYIIFADRLSFLKRSRHPLTAAALSLVIGVTFALIYSPCITPTLSDIMGLATHPQTAVQGWFLALHYGLGLSLSLGVAGTTLVFLLSRSRAAMEKTRLLKNICGIILLIPAFLNITGLMIQYKAFFLGLLV